LREGLGDLERGRVVSHAEARKRLRDERGSHGRVDRDRARGRRGDPRSTRDLLHVRTECLAVT
jgi:hypothetical protein